MPVQTATSCAQTPQKATRMTTSRGPGTGSATVSQTKALSRLPGSRSTSARIAADLQDCHRIDRTARAADHRQRTGSEQEFVATCCRQLVQQQSFQQRNAEVSDQPLRPRDPRAGGEGDALHGKIVGAQYGNLAFRQPQRRLDIQAWLAIE